VRGCVWLSLYVAVSLRGRRGRRRWRPASRQRVVDRHDDLFDRYRLVAVLVGSPHSLFAYAGGLH